MDTFSEIHAEVNGNPLNALSHVFLLLQDKHVVIKVLLKFFVHEVNHQLLEGVEIENFKPSNIQHTNVVDFFHGRINQGVVTHVNKVAEETSEDILDDGICTNFNCVDTLGLSNPFHANLQVQTI